MKAAWQGFIALGRLGIPVRLYTALQPAAPRFAQLHAADHSPVERVLQCRAEHKPIGMDEVVRAVEYEPGRYVVLTGHELERAAPSPAKAIAITQFSEPAAVDPLYYEKPYYVVPGRGGERAYALIREVFARMGMVAVAEFVIHNRERVAVLRTHGDMLVLHALRFASEIVPRERIKTPPLPKPSPAEIDMLQTVVERFSGPLFLQDYHNGRAEYINELVGRKSKGLPVPKRERPMPNATAEENILPALRDTLESRRMIARGSAA